MLKTGLDLAKTGFVAAGTAISNLMAGLGGYDAVLKAYNADLVASTVAERGTIATKEAVTAAY